jgi:hypothetical protein
MGITRLGNMHWWNMGRAYTGKGNAVLNTKISMILLFELAFYAQWSMPWQSAYVY